jgi:amino acid adenylation domain-containing protein
MDRLSERIAALSPAKRAILERYAQAKNSVQTDPVEVSQVPASVPLPLSFAQQRLWFLDQIEPGVSFYNLPLATRMQGPLIVSRLRESLNEIVCRHAILRTTFVSVEGQPMQVIAPSRLIEMPVLDLSGMPQAERELEIARQASIEGTRTFDLTQDMPIRCSLLRLDDTEHVLLVTIHHIASDGWSMKIFWSELSSLYVAFCSGQPSPLPLLPMQYADFAVWQRDWLTGKESEKLLSYWKEKLANAPPFLQLPTDRPRPRVQAFEGAAYAVPLSASLSQGLKALCMRTGATLYMVLLAAFNVFLCCYSGEADLVVGSPVANRNRLEFEKLIGFFVNTLVMRNDLSGDPTFSELIGRVRETALAAFAHQDLPFEKVVEELQPERNLGYNPIFQVMFVLQNFQSASQMGNQATAPQFSVGTSKFDLTFSAAEMADGLTIGFEYNSRLFEQRTIVAMAEILSTILHSVVEEPGMRISEIPLLSPEERRRIVEQSGTAGIPVLASLIHHLCEIPARETPRAKAVIFGSQFLTYQELNQRANQLGRALRDRGVGPEICVGVFMDRSPETIVALLGILKVGGVYVPFDPAYPRERIEYMFVDSQIPVFLTQEKLVSNLSHFSGEILCIDSDWSLLSAYSDDNLETQISPDNLAYIIYTSGSTGRPKGSMVEHRGVCNLAEAQINAFGWSASDRVLQFASLSFDASLFEVVMTLRAGAALCIAERDAILPGPPLVHLLREQKVSVLVIPPSALAVLPGFSLPDLRAIVAVGEVCPLEVANRWKIGRRFFNAYGPTEVSICSTIAECNNEQISPPIGRAIPNTQAYLLDEQMNPMPPGASGEIYLAGVGVSRGYYRHPSLTAERYLPDPFSRVPGARCYRTGDRARRLSNGELQYLGRADQQVKIRGHRIELAEIESALAQNPLVSQAAVLLQRAQSGEMRIIAYYVSETALDSAGATLRWFLKQSLPDFMLPAAFVRLDALPLNANGKLDRKALPPVSELAHLVTDTAATPRNAIEAELVRIWKELLELEPGIHENFFELGGHSLLATRALSRINTAFQIELSLREMFELPTVAELAQAVEQAKNTGPHAEESPIPRLPREVVTLASGSQP